jgi:LacI family transcriptional regulator, repressor for deo operon, udp, cdd, tsx, nupC, and nupG
MTSLIDIARELGLSKSTVSRAMRGMPGISPATVEAVRGVAEREGYVPSLAASGLTTGRHHAIGVVVPSLRRWFYASVVSGIDAALAEANYDVVLFDLSRGGGEERLFHRSLLRRRVDGLIVLSTDFAAEEQRQLDEVGLPTIGVGGPTHGMPRVGVDDRAVVVTATRHLVELGHRRIGLVGGVDVEGLNSKVPEIRSAAFFDTLAQAGIDVRDEWMLSGGYRFGQAKRAIEGLLASGVELPTALVCTSDEMAAGVMFALQGAGIVVPDEVSVIGIDGHEYAEPLGLTTVQQEPEQQGRDAAAWILAHLVGGSGDWPDVPPAPYELVLRSTTGRPPGE